MVSDVKGRDVKIDAYTLSFHDRLLIKGARDLSLNDGLWYDYLGENGSRKVNFSSYPFTSKNNSHSSDRLQSEILKSHLKLTSISSAANPSHLL